MTATTDPKRSQIMRSVKSKDTTPELIVRRIVHAHGYRYRLHRSDLPGKPDLVFGPRRKVIFVHGCFWHGHDCKRGARIPKTNTEYWEAKIRRNCERDEASQAALRDAGWQVLVIWECETSDIETMRQRLADFLEGTQSSSEATPM